MGGCGGDTPQSPFHIEALSKSPFFLPENKPPLPPQGGSKGGKTPLRFFLLQGSKIFVIIFFVIFYHFCHFLWFYHFSQFFDFFHVLMFFSIFFVKWLLDCEWAVVKIAVFPKSRVLDVTSNSPFWYSLSAFVFVEFIFGCFFIIFYVLMFL